MLGCEIWKLTCCLYEKIIGYGYLIWHKYIAVLTPTLGESTEESDIIFLVQKTIVSVELRCSKCRQKVMKLIATIEGITSIVLDPSKKTVTVIGEADPVKIIKKVRKFRKCATILSVGPPKEEKKEDKDSLMKQMIVPCAPKPCQRCDVWLLKI
ncbi:heavy metal-associated isoprenylated plant protein 43-like isoform X2 [Manihot esculenta]|uniref:heavy metal-associated isoprenylated plant protein 43-like isoform X2 n=1 Tax=Manihot esculenta TaxID=3983 RepID=UPI001CC3E25B|nr:heavy metal-associated isoprenylated plant protein 43-like isoform X2 [Manihot esculenta]